MPNFSNKFYFIEWNILFYVNFDLQKVEQKLKRNVKGGKEEGRF